MIAGRKAAALALAVALAIPAEGLRHYAYYDPAGILTACFGDTNDIEMGRFYSLDECRARLDKHMLAAINTVEQCHPGLPAPVLASFGDAVYNLGPTIACNDNSSTASRMLRAGNIEGACNQLPRWNKARVLGVMIALPGLTDRRGKEQALCLRAVGGGNG